MSLLRLPAELLRIIATTLSDEHLSCLLQVNHFLYSLLLPDLYQRRPKYGPDETGWPTNLFRAIATGNERGTRNFLHYGANVNIICSSGFLRIAKVPISPWFDKQTPLNIAASIGNDALVMMLLNRGAEINGVVQENLRHSRGPTQPAVVDALLSGHESTVRLLLERGSDLQGPHIEAGGLVSCAVKTGQLMMLKLLLEFGADMNIPYNGVYPLYHALCSQDISTDIARFLLDNGAELAPIDDGRGRLMKEVIRSGTIDTARLLLERGAIYPQDEFRSAIYGGTPESIRLLIEYGIKPDMDSLERAIRNQRLNLLQLFLEWGVDMNTRDSRGSTILHYAVSWCGFVLSNQRMIYPPPLGTCGPRQLVRRIAVIQPQNVSAPCSISHQKDDVEDILRYLIHKGADVNAKDGQGQTPLYLAWKCAPAVAHILLDSGATSERSFIKNEESDDDWW